MKSDRTLKLLAASALALSFNLCLPSATQAASPLVTTLPTSGVSNTVATLNGLVHPGGIATTAWFEWGLGTTPYTQRTEDLAIGSGGTTINVSHQLTGLSLGVVYHGRLVASNSVGVALGRDVAFGSPNLVLNGDEVVALFLDQAYIEAGATVAKEGPVAIAGGENHSLALRGDGTIIAWGDERSGIITVPADLNNAVAIDAGSFHSLALRSDGTITGWGVNLGGLSVPAGLNNVVAIAAGTSHGVALRSNGTVEGWGGLASCCAPTDLNNVVAIAAGDTHGLSLHSEGPQIRGWGANDYLQTRVPSGLGDVVAIAAGDLHSLALQRNGTVHGWGANFSNQRSIPAGLSNVVAIAAGDSFSLALRNDGTVEGWGLNDYLQTRVPAGLSNVVALAAGGRHSLALQNDGTVVAWGDNDYGQTIIPDLLYRELNIITNGHVNTSVAGTYVVTYSTTNSLGGVGAVMRTVQVSAPPAVTTLPANGVSDTVATLNGTVNPGNGVTTAWFLYGLTTNYGSFSATNTLAATNTVIPSASLISNLSPGRTYHFRLVARNGSGRTSGANLTFTTQGSPDITTLASAVIATNAVNGLRTVVLSAILNPGGLTTEVNFQYGVSSNYLASNSTTTPGSFSGNLVTTMITVDPGFTWHWRILASNGLGTTTSPDQTFRLESLVNGLAGDTNGDGLVSQSELEAVYANYVTNSPWLYLTNVEGLGGTNVSFALENSLSGAYTVEFTTNLVDWFRLGPATPRYLFTDTNAPALPRRYYRLIYP